MRIITARTLRWTAAWLLVLYASALLLPSAPVPCFFLVFCAPMR